MKFIHTCNENTVVKPPFVSSRRILTLVIGDKVKRLCVLSEHRLRTWVSVPHMVSADSKRRKYISTSHDRSQQWLVENLVGISAGKIYFGSNNPFSWLPPTRIRLMPLVDADFLYGPCSETFCRRFRCFRATRRPTTIGGPHRGTVTCRLQSRPKCALPPSL